MTVEIEVLESDIATGERGNSCFCPIAIAIERKLRKAVKVNGQVIFIEDKKIPTPLSAKNFIYCFDSGEPVRPFSFTLEW